MLQASDVRELPAGALMGRIHSSAGEFPTRWDQMRRFGPTTARFDHQPPPPRMHPERRVMYAVPALDGPDGVALPLLRTCVAEVFRDRGAVELSRDQAYFVVFGLARPVRLLDVVDSTWVTRAGGNGAISSGLRSTSRDWARAVHRHYQGDEALDGIFYGCSNIPAARSVTLWERAESALPARPAAHLPLSHPALRAELEAYASEMGLILIP